MPHDHLTAIADYLPKSSRALFAVALTAPSKSFSTSNWKGKLSEASKAIISSTISGPFIPVPESNGWEDARLKDYYSKDGWEKLDFIDSRDLSKKLSEDDIGAVLVCIDAKNKLKSLRLNCIDIVGHALEPLREATTIEEIAFKMDTKQLSKSTVLPIIESIIDTEGSSLFKKWCVYDNSENTNGDPPLVLPTEWKEGKSRYEQPLNGFLSKVNQMLISEGKCRADCHAKRQKDGGTNTGHMSCLTCFSTYCSDCNGNETYSVLKCDKCNLTLCTWCEQDFATCRECNSTFCSVCAEEDDVDAAKQCGDCWLNHDPICFGCVTPANEECKTCLGMFFSDLSRRNEELGNEIGGLCDENEELREENKTQKAENDDLRKENEELRKQLSAGLGILG